MDEIIREYGSAAVSAIGGISLLWVLGNVLFSNSGMVACFIRIIIFGG